MFSIYSELRTMDNVQKSSDSEDYPWSKTIINNIIGNYYYYAALKH
jgi:hypothetical protein